MSSGNVHDAVVGRMKATFESRGRLALKNIEGRIQAFRVGWDPTDWQASTVAATPQPTDGALTLPDQASMAFTARPAVAVLPFDNMSGDPAEEYFVDGLTEDIITTLSYWRWFPVIARNSTFAYKGKPKNAAQIGTDLGAAYIVEGSARRVGNRVRIPPQPTQSPPRHHPLADPSPLATP